VRLKVHAGVCEQRKDENNRPLPILNSKGETCTTSAMFEQQIYSDAWMSNVGSCAVTRRLSMLEDDGNKTLLAEMTKAFKAHTIITVPVDSHSRPELLSPAPLTSRVCLREPNWQSTGITNYESLPLDASIVSDPL
jgi:hypothetical protein